MYYLTPMCFICLKSKSDLTIFNTEMVTKLLYCIQNTEDYILPFSDHIQICSDCLNKLNAAFNFKKMILNNIIQFKDYITQLEQVYNNFNSYKVITVKLIDIHKVKKDMDDYEFVDLNLKQYSNEHAGTAFIKTENLGELYFENYDHNESRKMHLDKELKMNSQTQEIKEKLQYPSAKMSIFDSAHLQLQQHANTQIETVLVKTEIFDENELNVLHKEEILDEVNSEKQESPRKSFLEHGHWQAPESSEFVINEQRKLIKHNKRSYCCDKCQKCFKIKGNLKRHMLIHTNERAYSCSLCGKSFIQKTHLQKHILVHSKEQVYPCSVCNKNLFSKASLSRHMLMHYNKRPYSCSKCTKSFIAKQHLSRHILTHSTERPYSCAVCKKSFTSQSYLNKHTLIHGNRRQFSCSICMKSFTQKYDLSRHVLLHTNVPSYSCSVCMKSFIRKSDLNQHTSIHSNERPYSCLICEKSFTCKRYLHQHTSLHCSKVLHENVSGNTIGD